MRKWHRWTTVFFGVFMMWMAITGLGSHLIAQWPETAQPDYSPVPDSFVCPETMMCRPIQPTVIYWLHMDAVNIMVNSLHCDATKIVKEATMSVTPTSDAKESFYLLGETLAPMLTNDMGSAVEIFDTSGPTGGGPPTHRHAWEEIYVVTKGVLDVTVNGDTTRLGPGGFAHVPANTPHSYHTVEDAEFLTIVTKGNASKFFRQVSSEVSMNPPDFPAIVRIGDIHGIEFLTST